MLEHCFDAGHDEQQPGTQAMDELLICWPAIGQKVRDEMRLEEA
jgi:hypothetical protein